VFVVAASVIDAYVTALRHNRERERRQREATPERADRETPTDRPDGPVVTDRSPADAEAVSCPHCGRDTDASFDFCQWCAESVSE